MTGRPLPRLVALHLSLAVVFPAVACGQSQFPPASELAAATW